MVRRRTAAICLFVALLIIAASYGSGGVRQTWGDHSFTTVRVDSANAYRHVLETDDRLVLIQYSTHEDPDEDESAYGASGIIAQLTLGSTVLEQQTIPLAGYGLAAFYLNASSSSALPWAFATAQGRTTENPLIVTSPKTSSLVLNWNSTSDLADTADELETDLKEILASIEAQAPDDIAAPGDYVSVYGITVAGQLIVSAAFPQLVTIAAQAFEIARVQVGTDYDPKDVQLGGLAVPLQAETFKDAVAASSTEATVELSARHFYASTTSMTVTRSAGFGVITSSCTLDGDQVTLDCTGLTVSASSTDLSVTYYSATEGEDSPFMKGVKQLGGAFGIPFNATRVLFVFAIFGALFYINRKWTHGDAEYLFISQSGGVLFYSARVGALPWQAASMLLFLVFVFGAWVTLKRILG